MLAMFTGLNGVKVVNSYHGRVDRAEKSAWKITNQMAIQLGAIELSHSGLADAMAMTVIPSRCSVSTLR
jgi:hypothetical protein